MLGQDNLETIKKTIEEFLEKMGLEAKVEVSLKEEYEASSTQRTLFINVETEEPQILIGARGESLLEIQHIIKLILRKKAGIAEMPFYVDLDINDYKKKKNNYLKEMAKSAAEEVLLTKKEKILPPMSSYERRIVHLVLAQRRDIVSESVGQEPERKVVIRPRP